MKYNAAFVLKLIPLYLSVILLSNVEAKHDNIEGQRKGWKTNGNGYFVYKTTTSFETKGQITINGTFSTLPNVTGKNMLIAAEDASGYNFFQFWVENGHQYRTFPVFTPLEQSEELTGITSGSVFHFTLKLSEIVDDESYGDGYFYKLDTWFEGLPSMMSMARNANKDDLNLKNVTFFIGGYNLTSENYFHGCLSDFVFDGVDIIKTYFDQYPNNLNPTKGLFEVNDFSNQPETCEDLTTTSTVAPTTDPTTENASLRPQSFSYVLHFLFVFTILLSRNFKVYQV